MSHTNLSNDKLKHFSKTNTGVLFLVATPIGNLKDITYRAIETLKSVDLVACEDTRVTKKLLDHYGIDTKCITYNDHSNQKNRDRLILDLQSGKNIALVSDAGTPMISDPGYKLVSNAANSDIKIESIPGACAAITALTLSALPSDKFYFHGFINNKSDFDKLKDIDATLVFYESPRRLVKTLGLMKDAFGNRNASVTRELTKMFEEVERDNLDNLIKFYLKHENLKGEVVVLVEGSAHQELGDEAINQLLEELLKTMSVKDAVAEIVTNYGTSKKKVYDLALRIKNH